MKRAWLLVLLAGCVTFEAPEPVEVYSAEEIEAWFDATTQARFTLADFTNDTLVLELLTTAPVQARMESALPQAAGLGADEGTPRPCVSYYTPNFRAVGFGSLRHPMVAVQVGGEEARLEAPSYDGTYNGGWDHEMESWDVGHPVHVAIGLADVAAWDDAPWTYTLQSSEPFHVRVLEGGTMSCLGELTDMEGVAVDLGLAAAARDLEHHFESNTTTLSGVYFGATGRFCGFLEGPEQFYKEFCGANGYVFQMGFLDPGAYRMHIDEMVSAQDPAASATWPSGAVILQHDVPAWALQAPWEPVRVDA